MEQRECAVQLINKDQEMNQSVEQSTAHRQGNKRHNVSARKAKGTTCAHKELLGMLKQKWYFFTLLGLLPRAFARGCKSQTTHYLCRISSYHEGCLAAIDRNGRRLVDLRRETPSTGISRSIHIGQFVTRACTRKHWMTVLDTFKSEFLLTSVCVDMSQSHCSLVPFQCFSACCLCVKMRCYAWFSPFCTETCAAATRS